MLAARERIQPRQHRPREARDRDLLRGRVLDYLNAVGPRTSRQIKEALLPEYAVTPNAIDQTVYRLYREGRIDRCGWARYKIVGPSAVEMMNRWLVVSLLDRLFADYPDAMEDELRRRGWRRA